jgi:hypothetical protein
VSRTQRRATVQSFDELMNRPLAGGINALCWPRTLDGDFGEVARLLAYPPMDASSEGVRVIAPEHLAALELSRAGRAAADHMLDDLRRLDALGHEPVLNCITRYPSDTRGFAVATDVMSFHADRSPVEVDTWLCTYHGKSSEGLDNDDAVRRVDSPAIRAALLKDYGGQDDDGFAEFLREGSFDLHYAAIAGAEPFAFGVAHLWRIAVAWPGCPVPPCIHRAPPTVDGDTPRLLLIC